MPIKKIKKNDQENSVQIYSDKKASNKIIRLLAGQHCYYKFHRSLSGSYLKLNYHALKILQNNEQLWVELKPLLSTILPDSVQGLENKEEAFIDAGLKKEEAFEKQLEEKNYNLSHRIWFNRENNQDIYSTKVGSRIYSADDLDIIIGLLSGTHLIRTSKPPIYLHENPIGAFGVLNVAYDFLSRNKSVLHGIGTKKNYRSLTPKTYTPPVFLALGSNLVDGVMGISIPSYVSTKIQSLLIWPILLKGAHVSHADLVKEIKYIKGQNNRAWIKIEEIDHELSEFKKELCEIVGCSYDSINDPDDNPQDFVKKISSRFSQNLRNSKSGEGNTLTYHKANETIAKIVDLCNKYEKSITQKNELPGTLDVIMAYCNWLVNVDIIASASFHEAIKAADIEMLHDEFPDPSDQLEYALHIASSSFGYAGAAGQVIGSIYSFYNVFVEGKSWQKTSEELAKFKDVKNVSKLAKGIVKNILSSKKNSHIAKVFARATMGIGQLALAIGSEAVLSNPFVIATTGTTSAMLSPIFLYGGFGFATAGTLMANFTDLVFKNHYPEDNKTDVITQELLKKFPEFDVDQMVDINVAISKRVQRQVFALEILGHLREIHSVLYKNFLEINDDCQSITEKFLLFGKDIGIIEKNSKVDRALTQHLKERPYKLDMLQVEENDIDFIWKLSAKLAALHDLKNRNDYSSLKKIIGEINAILKSEGEFQSIDEEDDIDEIHKYIISEIQETFIKNKIAAAAEEKEQDKKNPIIELCQKAIDHGWAGAQYSKQKICRAVDEGKLHYKEGISPVKKNIKIKVVGVANLYAKTKQYIVRKKLSEVEVLKFDLNEFNEEELTKLLNKKRLTKNWRRLIPAKLTEYVIEKHLNKSWRKLIPSHRKRSILETTIAEDFPHRKSKKIKPFKDLMKVSMANKIFEEEKKCRKNSQKEKYIKPISNYKSKASNKFLNLPKKPFESNPYEFLNITSKGQSELLNELENLTNKKVATNDEERISQITAQNEIIKKLTKKTRPFLLKSRITNDDKSETIFIYESPKNPGSKDHEIIYKRNNKNGEIKVIYGDKVRAIIAQKATQKHNAFVAIISENKVEEFGDKKNSSFKKFKSKSEDEINIGTSPRPLHGRSLKNNLETNRSAERFSSNIILS